MTTVFPIVPHSSGRYFVDQNGVPFFIIGDSAQTIVSRLSLTDVDTYFADRVAQGFNTIFIELSSHQTSVSPCPASFLGDQPFTTNKTGGTYTGATGTADFSTPKTTYWNYVDSIFNLAETHNLLIIAYVMAWGFGLDGTQGWWPDIVNNVNTPAVCTGFGTFLGNRYKNRTGVMWMEGSDSFGNSTVVTGGGSGISRSWNIMTAMIAAGAVQLRSGDWAAPSESTNGPVDTGTGDSFPNYITANGSYTYGGLYPGALTFTLTTYLEARSGYNYVPVATTQSYSGLVIPPAIPAFLKETTYEHSPFAPGAPSDLRKAQYYAILSGDVAGYVYGDEHIWPFPGSGAWQTAINDTSALDVQRFSSLIKTVPWWKYYPSELSGMIRLITTSNGSQSGNPTNYVAAAQAYDGSSLMVYFADVGTSQTATIDLTRMAGNVRLRLWDPTSGTTGAFTLIGTFPNTGTHSYTTPGTNNSAGDTDWFVIGDSPVAGGLYFGSGTTS